MEKPHAGRFVARLWRVVASLLVLLSLLVAQSIYTSRRQHEEQAVVETTAWRGCSRATWRAYSTR